MSLDGAAAPIRFALLGVTDPVPRWQAECVRALVTSGEVECVAVLVGPPMRRAARGASDRLYAALVRCATRALDPADPAPGVPRLDPSRWDAAGPLDFVLAFEVVPGMPEPEMARWGTWQLRIGGRPAAPDVLPGLAEVAARLPSLRIEVVARVADTWRVLHRARLPMRRTQARLLDGLGAAAGAVCAGAARRAARDALPGDTTPAAVEAPSRGAAAAVVGQMRGIMDRVAGLFFRDDWIMGVVEAAPETLLAGGAPPAPRWLAPPQRGRFHADPFPLVAGGRDHLLFEVYDEAEGRGWIAAMQFGAPDAEAATALDLGCHMSYPGLFLFEGATYCAPEIAAAGGLRLFRMGPTPWDWAEAGDAMPGARLADPTLFEHAGRWWLFATPDGPAADAELHLWHAATPFGPWTPHPLNPVRSDVHAARPAGAVFRAGGKLIRPGQDCAGAYGRAVVLHRVLRLDPDGYEEIEVARLEPGRDWPARDGLHTLNGIGASGGSHLFVLDAKRRVPDAMAPLRPLLRRLRRGRWSGPREDAHAVRPGP